MRPNLMAPRRASTSGEDSILAMLEREPARKRSKGASSARLAWYGASAAMAVALTGALVWMAANNDGMGRDVQNAVLAEAGKPAGPQLADSTGSSVVAASAPTAGAALVQVAMAPPAPRSAMIVDQPPPADGVPPLRLLKPAPAKSPTPALREPAPAARLPARAVASAPPRPAPVPQPEAKPVSRPAATPAKPRPVLVAKNAARAVQPRAARANPARPAEAGVDADVALISAVIVHANGHAPEGSQMTELLCPNDSCKASQPRQ